MPGIVLYDEKNTPLRFRYRLPGGDTDRIHGKALKGHFVDELEPPAFAEMLHDDFAKLITECRPQLARLDFRNAEGNMRRYEALRLPPLDNQETVEMIMVYANHGQRLY